MTIREYRTRRRHRRTQQLTSAVRSIVLTLLVVGLALAAQTP